MKTAAPSTTVAPSSDSRTHSPLVDGLPGTRMSAQAVYSTPAR
jgi:hypothetical protein